MGTHISRDVAELSAQASKPADDGRLIEKGFDPLLRGLYGQSSHDVARTWIHQRSTGYSINFYLRLEGGVEVLTFSSFEW